MDMNNELDFLSRLKKMDVEDLEYFLKDEQQIANSFNNRNFTPALENALKQAIANQGRRDFERMQKTTAYPIYPDYVSRPDCLGYVIQNGYLSQEEIGKIPFDHGDTAQTFPNNYGAENLVEKIREEFFPSK